MCSSDLLKAADVARLADAYRFSEAAHAGQLRQSGEPYISHPVAVAEILADWRLDGQALVAALLTRLPTVPNTEHVPMRVMREHLRSPKVRVGLWIPSVPGFALGVLTLSGTYRLDEVGAGATVIAIAFSGIAVINVFVAPKIGQASDRLGRRRPLMLALAVAGIAVVLIAAAAFEVSTVALIAIAGAFMLAVAGPGLALVGDGIHEEGGDPAHATFLMNLFWGPSAALGAIAAGLVHGSIGAEVSLLMLAAIVALSFVFVRRLA